MNTKYSKELVTRICHLIASGMTVTEVCERVDIPVTARTVFYWRHKYAGFKELYDQSYLAFWIN